MNKSTLVRMEPRKLRWSIVLGYHVVRKILPFNYSFRVEKWRSYSGLDLDPSEMVSFWHPYMWETKS